MGTACVHAGAAGSSRPLDEPAVIAVSALSLADHGDKPVALARLQQNTGRLSGVVAKSHLIGPTRMILARLPAPDRRRTHPSGQPPRIARCRRLTYIAAMKIRVLVRKRRNRRMFVVQLLNIRDEWAQLREFDDFDETAAYLKHLKAHDKVTDDDIEYSTT